MKGIKGFVLGFSLSLVSVSLSGQLYTSTAIHTYPLSASGIKIDLFKKGNDTPVQAAPNIFSEIKKYSIAQQAALPDNKPLTLSNLENENSAPADAAAVIAYAPDGVDGIDDDEILSANINDNIPIEFGNSANMAAEAKISHEASGSQVAMLPADAHTLNDDFASDSPWVVAESNRHIKNKKLLEKFAASQTPNLLTDGFKEAMDNDKEISYQVAEKIKQSIIFPIPDEILNDENLTPTFIKNGTKIPPAKPAPKVLPPAATEKSEPTAAAAITDLKILPKEKTEEKAKTEPSKSLLTSISSWFTDTPATTEAPVKKQAKQAPAYNSQGKTPPQAAALDSADDLVSFYETLQETKDEHIRHNIIPSELKLSFQPGRAEISGQTLRWLKAFSEATKDGKTYLQVRLDATASVELQRKRLNLLYTIFMNNGVDFQKVDTVFSLTEPNAFIIRTLKLK